MILSDHDRASSDESIMLVMIVEAQPPNKRLSLQGLVVMRTMCFWQRFRDARYSAARVCPIWSLKRPLKQSEENGKNKSADLGWSLNGTTVIYASVAGSRSSMYWIQVRSNTVFETTARRNVCWPHFTQYAAELDDAPPVWVPDMKSWTSNVFPRRSERIQVETEEWPIRFYLISVSWTNDVPTDNILFCDAFVIARREAEKPIS